MAWPAAPLSAGSNYGLVKSYPNPSPTPQDEFGNAVAWLPSGSTIAVAARSDRLGGSDVVGAVYLLDRNSGSIVHVLSRGGAAASDYLGFSLSVSGTQVLVGAPHDNTGALRAGAAYLFDSVSGGVVVTFTDPVGVSDDNFGASVAILSNTAVLVGEPGYDALTQTVQNVGRAYVCLLADTTCPTALDPPNPTDHDGATFGFSVAALGDKFAVGAPLDGNLGAVYVYTSTTGELAYTIVPTITSVGDFGWSLASVNGNVLIGAQNDSPGAIPNAGGAYLYQPDGTLLRTFHSPTPESGANFGAAVASDGTFILIGAPRAAGGDGRAYLFSASSGALIATFQDNLTGSHDNFGNSVAVLGENFLVGAPGDSPTALGGAAYRFGVLPPRPANFAGSSKTVNATMARPGDLITYTLTLTNSGTISATFGLTDTLDPHVSLVSAPGLSGSGTLTATGLLSGTTQLSFLVTVRASQPFSGTVANVAHLSGDGSLRSLTAPLVAVAARVWLPIARR